jgi:hypothetical protein
MTTLYTSSAANRIVFAGPLADAFGSADGGRAGSAAVPCAAGSGRSWCRARGRPQSCRAGRRDRRRAGLCSGGRRRRAISSRPWRTGCRSTPLPSPDELFVHVGEPVEGEVPQPITGADSGVLTTAANAFRPLYQQRFPVDLGVAELRALLLVPVHALLHRIDIDERQGPPRLGAAAPAAPVPPGTAGSPSPAGRRCPGYNSAGASPAWTARGCRRTACSWRRAAAGPWIDQVCPGRHAPDQARDFRGRVDPALAARHAAPGPSPGPGRLATRDPGRPTMRASSRGYATIAFDGRPSGPGDGSVRDSYRPSSEGAFQVDMPTTALFGLCIEAKPGLDGWVGGWE